MEDGTDRDRRVATRLSELAPLVMLTVTRTGTITWISSSVERVFRLTRDEILGTNIFDHVDVPWNAEAIDSVAYAMETSGLQRPMLFRLIRGDGTGMITEISANAQFDDPDIDGLAVYARRWDERWSFDQVLDAMAENAPLPDVLDLVLEVMGTENLDAQGVIIYHDPLTDERRTRSHRGLGPAQRQAADTPGTPWSTAWHEQVPCSVPVEALPEPFAAEAAERGHRWCWAWPVVARDGSGTVGALVLWRQLDEPPDHTCRMTLRRLVRFIGLLFRREAMTSALRHAALHDPLTELGNRAAFFAHLDRAIDYSPGRAAVGHRVGVISIDLDGFKPVNDRLGHAAGDDVLRTVAERLRTHVRTEDVVARLGGDEFCIVCGEVSTPEEVTRLADRIVAVIGEPITTRAGTVRISASVGVALCVPGTCTTDALLDAADRAMYRAKAEGPGVWRLGKPDARDRGPVS